MSAVTPRRVISVVCQFIVHLQCHLPRKFDRIWDSEMLRKSVHEGKGRKSRCQTPLSWRILKQRVLDVFDWSSNCQIIARNLTQQPSLSLYLLLLPLRMSMCLRLYFFPLHSSDKSCVYMWVWVPVGGTTFLPTSINVFSWYVRQKENLRFEKKTCQLQACTPQGFQQFSY